MPKISKKIKVKPRDANYERLLNQYSQAEATPQQRVMTNMILNLYKTGFIYTGKVTEKLIDKYKDKITEYYKSRLWDKYKKLSNEYEHIFYSPNAHGNIALYNPVSRSFFKLWEILYDFQDITFVNSPTPLKCVFIAEGPGGFFEAFYKKRQELFPSLKDRHHGITLKSNNNKNIPDWKTQESLPL
jgi:hypothetical protein